MLLARLGWRTVGVGSDRVWLRTGVPDNQRQADFTDWLAARHVVAILRRTNSECVIDVGANEGQFVRSLRLEGWTGRAVSIEPDSRARQVLERFAARDPAWTVLPYGLGDSDGEAMLTLRTASTLTSLRSPRPDARVLETAGIAGSLAPTGTERIQVRRLDTIWSELGCTTALRSTFLKIDTQGYDEVVLRGASGVLPFISGIQSEIAVEHIYDGVSDYVSRLEALNGMGFTLNGAFSVSIDHRSGLLVEFDGVFVPTRQGREE